MFIHIDHLYFQYKNSKEQTIRDFSLVIKQGEMVAIEGESGSGKSTILRLIAGLEVPQSGTIRINDRVMFDPCTFVPPEKRGVGLVFQDYALFPHMSVAENVTFGLKGLSKEEQQNRLATLLELVGLRGYEHRYPYELSGGQQQRIAIIRALAPNPSVIMFDEPFSNLDKAIQRKIRQEIHDILKSAGVTSIFVTHDLDDSKHLVDRVIVLKQGSYVSGV
jgi:iron(III) transport system ATP-binding protein